MMDTERLFFFFAVPATPSDAGVLNSVQLGVGLDVDERGAIQRIHTPNLQETTFAFHEIHNAEADRVWPIWRPGGEHTVHFRSPRCSSLKDMSIALIQPIEDDEMRALSDVQQGRFVCLKNL
jgi:hypothetical protein